MCALARVSFTYLHTTIIPPNEIPGYAPVADVGLYITSRAKNCKHFGGDPARRLGPAERVEFSEAATSRSSLWWPLHVGRRRRKDAHRRQAKWHAARTARWLASMDRIAVGRQEEAPEGGGLDTVVPLSTAPSRYQMWRRHVLTTIDPSSPPSSPLFSSWCVRRQHRRTVTPCSAMWPIGQCSRQLHTVNCRQNVSKTFNAASHVGL